MTRARKQPPPAKKKRKNPEQRSNSTKVSALTMVKNGESQVSVAKALNIPERTLRRWKKESIDSGMWMGSAGDTKARPAKRRSDPGSGRPRKLTKELKAKIKRKLNADPFLTPYGLQNMIPGLRNISKRSIRRCIAKELGIPSRIAAKKPFLTEAQKARRLSWALRHRGWSRVKWARVLWSDETHLEQWRGGQTQRRVRRSSSISRYHPNFIVRTTKHPPKLMVWAAFGNSKLGQLYFVEKNAKMNAAMYQQVLQRHLKPSLRQTGCSVFMQDGAPCHTAKSIKAWLAASEVPVLDWVGNSPDCNPIENLWRGLKREVNKLGAASNLDDLTNKIKKAWKNLAKDRQLLRNLTYSMPARIEEVIAANGDVTRY